MSANVESGNILADMPGAASDGASIDSMSADSLATPETLSAAESAFFYAAQSLLLERRRLYQMAGFNQFGGSRQMFDTLGYPDAITLSDYQDRFRRGGIARRIVSAAPKAMGWAKLDIIENGDPKNVTDFEREWRNLAQRLNIGNVLKRADILAGVGEYSVIYIGVRERGSVGNVDALASEMSRLSGPDDVVYLRPLSQQLATIQEYVGDSADDRIDDPRYGLPKYYQIQLSGIRRSGLNGLGAIGGGIRKVHWSRIIHVTHEPLDNELFSAPALEAVWNYLMDLDKLAGGGSEIYWKQALQKVLFDLDKDIGPDGGSISSSGVVDPNKTAAFKASLEKLKSDLDDMVNNLRPHVFTRGITPKTIETKTPNFEGNVRVILSLIAATIEIPQRKLFGSEQAKLASVQDSDTFNDFKGVRQDEFGAALARQLVGRLIKYNGLPTPKLGSDCFFPKWALEEELNEKQKAEVVLALAQANQAQYQSDGTIINTRDEIREIQGKDPLPADVGVATVAEPNNDNGDADGINVNEEHKFSSTQIDIAEPLRSDFVRLGLSIADDDLIDPGREIAPHVTVKYGIWTEKPELVHQLIRDYGVISLRFGEVSVFANPDADVVYVAVDSPDLVALNKLISGNLKVTDTQDTYVPHITLAHVKPGAGTKYSDRLAFAGKSYIATEIKFSDTSGAETVISTVEAM